MKKVYLFLCLVCLTFTNLFAQPTVSVTTPPTRNATDVVSIYNDGPYTSLTGTDFNPNWGQNGFAAATEITIGASDKVRRYPNFNYQGIQFTGTNISSFDSLHIDVWSPDCTILDIYLIANGAGEKFVSKNVTLSGWNRFNIKLSDYSNQGLSLTNIFQFKFVSNTPASGTTIYLDNIYFYKSANAPTLSNFNVPAKVLGDAKFKLTAPTSNSAGAFTYTSANTGVATIVGDSVTIVGVGSSNITATQAANGAYTSGSISATLFVTSPGPTSAAPTPTKPAANVISLYSNAYTNRTVDTWSASWDQADLTDLQIAGNNTKKYTNLVFAGIEFTSSVINVTNAEFYHIDIWTPDATNFKVKLVDFGANGIYGGGDDVEHEYTVTPPTLNTWVSYDIPMSAFTGLTTRAHLAQMLFISSNSTVYVDNVFFWANTVLPINLTSLTATKDGNKGLLNWSTSTETNNYGFEVERSNDAKTWNRISFVKGNGNSNVQSNYNFLDENLFKGTNYYRLKQIDFDGKFNYTSVVSIRFADKDNLSVSFYPNPTKGKIVVLSESTISERASLNIFDLNGKLMKSITLTAQMANSNISVDVSDLSKGLYLISLNNNGAIKTSKLLIN